MSKADEAPTSKAQEATGAELLAPGPIEVAFHWAMDALEGLCKTMLLDEETLTASFLGALRVAVPAATECCGSGIAERTRRCSWAGFNKSGRVTDKTSEAANGADFALVLWESETHARICVVQAKRSEVKGPAGTFDIHSSPSRPSARSPQLAMLAATGVRFTQALAAAKARAEADAIGNEDATSLPDRSAALAMLRDAKPDGRMRLIKQLNWIQYLVYHRGVPVCIPLSEIPDEAIAKEFAPGAARSNNVDIGFGPATLRALIRSGLSEAEPQNGWLKVDRDTLEALLPDLLELVQVYETTGRGGGLVSQADDRVEVIAQPSSPAKVASLLAEASETAPSARSGMGSTM